MKKSEEGTNLEVGVHADHGLALCLSETPDDGAAEPALVRPDEDADGEPFLLELVHKLDRAVARVVVDDEDLDGAQGDGRGRVGEGGADAGEEGPDVEDLLVSGDDDRVGRRVGHAGQSERESI